jgi:hypothetical protein
VIRVSIRVIAATRDAWQGGASGLSAGAGQCESRKNRLDERNTNLRSAPPSHAATADGCVVKHKIECIGNSDGTFHLEAGTQVRQVEDRTIDRRPAALKGDACSLESPAGAARFISTLLLRFIHCFDLPATRAQARFPWPSSPSLAWLVKHEGWARSLAPNVPPDEPRRRPLTWSTSDQGLRLVDSRWSASP